MFKYINKWRLLAISFKVKDIIMLNARNIKIIRLNKLLDYKNIGLFKVIRVINNMIYELDLFNDINIFSVFYL